MANAGPNTNGSQVGDVEGSAVKLRAVERSEFEWRGV